MAMVKKRDIKKNGNSDLLLGLLEPECPSLTGCDDRFQPNLYLFHMAVTIRTARSANIQGEKCS